MPVPIAASVVVGAIVGALSRLFASRAGSWVAGILVFLGIGLVSHGVVVGPALDQIKAYAETVGSGAGSVAVEWLAFLNFDKAITMIFSAYATRTAINGGRVWLARR